MAVIPPRAIKCVAWDLDDTLWSGTLLEDREVRLRSGIVEVLETLDRRGILNSIASRNEESLAIERLRQFSIDHFFLYPQINWNSKANSIEAIASELNLGLSEFAFVDDQAFEREEVAQALPDVLVIPAEEAPCLAERPDMTPPFITSESSLRREMVRQEQVRRKVEREFVGPQEEFLAGLKMAMEIHEARQEDLERAVELTVRTNQLNATGQTYSYDELDRFRSSSEHLLLVASLTDRFGDYGTIGLALVQLGHRAWRLKLLLMSCRVMSRGVGSVLLTEVLRRARSAGARLQADFKPTERNRMMYITYKFLGFKQVGAERDIQVLERTTESIPEFPKYIDRVGFADR